MADSLVTRLRGFDLGDDEQRAQRCSELADAGELSAAGWQLRGVLCWRAGDFDRAASCFSRARAEDTDNDAATNRYLEAYARMRAGDGEAALQILAELESQLAATTTSEEEDDEEEISLVALRHGLGDALWTLGRLEEAEQAYSERLQVKSTAIGWWELARIRTARGDSAGALQAIDRAVELDDYDELHEARYLQAALRAAAGDSTGAIEALDQALRWSDEYRHQALTDERFGALIGNVAFDERTAGSASAPADLSWMDNHEGLAALRDDPALRKLGLRFVGEAESREGGDALGERYADTWHLGVLWSEPLWSRCQAAVVGKRLLARGPSVHNRSGYDVDTLVYFDPRRPGKVWLAPSQDIPATLFVDIDADPASVREAVESLYPRERIATLELPCHRRALMGYLFSTAVPNPYSGELEEAGPHELDRHWISSPALDHLCWGTSQRDEPWPDHIPAQPGYQLKINAMAQRVRQQEEHGVCRFTRRSLFSRSQVGYEIHQQRLFVWDIRYRPNPYPKTIERFNAQLGTKYPSDLPVDVVTALLGFEFLEAEDLEQELSEQQDKGAGAEVIGAYLSAIAAVRHSDVTVTALLRRYLDHGDLSLRETIGNLCLAYNWESLLEDIGISDPDLDIRQTVERILVGGIAPPRYDEYGEPVGLYDRYNEDDEDDDDEDGEGEDG